MPKVGDRKIREFMIINPLLKIKHFLKKSKFQNFIVYEVEIEILFLLKEWRKMNQLPELRNF